VARPASSLFAAGGLLVLPLALFCAAAPAAAAPKTYTVVMDKMKFGPLPQGLRAGDTILWVNRDFFRHSATAANGSFNVDLMPKQSGRTVLRRPGSIAFSCKYHPGMKGSLTVLPAASGKR
jgi:plastocyanin